MTESVFIIDQELLSWSFFMPKIKWHRFLFLKHSDSAIRANNLRLLLSSLNHKCDVMELQTHFLFDSFEIGLANCKLDVAKFGDHIEPILTRMEASWLVVLAQLEFVVDRHASAMVKSKPNQSRVTGKGKEKIES